MKKKTLFIILAIILVGCVLAAKNDDSSEQQNNPNTRLESSDNSVVKNVPSNTQSTSTHSSVEDIDYETPLPEAKTYEVLIALDYQEALFTSNTPMNVYIDEEKINQQEAGVEQAYSMYLEEGKHKFYLRDDGIYKSSTIEFEVSATRCMFFFAAKTRLTFGVEVWDETDNYVPRIYVDDESSLPPGTYAVTINFEYEKVAGTTNSPMNVYVDGEKYGRQEAGATQVYVIPLTEGEHEFYLRNDGLYETDKIKFTVTSDDCTFAFGASTRSTFGMDLWDYGQLLDDIP